METIQTILTPETSQPKYSHSEKKEFEKFDEKTIIHELRDLWKKGASRGTIVSGLSFCNSEEAWDLREDVLSSAKDSSLDNKKIIASDMAVGLSGINNQRSWELRKKFLKDGVDPEYLAMSVMGIDSDEATEWRKKIRKEALNNNENFKSAVFRGLFKSLRGLGSLEANNFRKNL